MMKKIEEVRELLSEPETFNKLAAKYETDPTEDNLRAVIDQITIELAKGNLKGMKSKGEDPGT